MMKGAKKQFTGKYTLPGGREVFGSLHICGESSKAELFDDEQFLPIPEVYNYIPGQLHDGRLVSLLQATLMRTGSRFAGSAVRKHSAEVFPHFVALGPVHISPSAPCIEKITFAMEDATTIFYDFDAFSTILDTKPLIPLLRNAVAKYRQVEFGDHPIVAYFTGKFEIAAVKTLIGEVRAEHRPTFTSGGPSGVRIDNEVVVTLTSPEPVTFQEGILRLSVLLRFFSLVTGREQPLRSLTVMLADQPDRSSPVEVYRSFTPRLRWDDDQDGSRRPHPADVLVSTHNDSIQYSTVLKNYLESDPERHDGRARLQNSLKDNRLYTIDRLIAAANLFDIFPDSAYPDRAALTSDLAAATEEARRLFRALPDSLERSGVLDALGRVGTLSLKHKIRHRVESTGLNEHFPRLIDVLKEAVNCRNHYVHGTPGRIDYSSNFDVVCFFTDALEFAFAASDLIDVGWDFCAWKSGRPGHSHLFAGFIVNYKDQLRYFEELLDGGKGQGNHNQPLTAEGGSYE